MTLPRLLFKGFFFFFKSCFHSRLIGKDFGGGVTLYVETDKGAKREDRLLVDNELFFFS